MLIDNGSKLRVYKQLKVMLVKLKSLMHYYKEWENIANPLCKYLFLILLLCSHVNFNFKEHFIRITLSYFHVRCLPGYFAEYPIKIDNSVILRLTGRIVDAFAILLDSCGLSSHSIWLLSSGYLFAICNTATKRNKKELKSNLSVLSLCFF